MDTQNLADGSTVSLDQKGKSAMSTPTSKVFSKAVENICDIIMTVKKITPTSKMFINAFAIMGNKIITFKLILKLF